MVLLNLANAASESAVIRRETSIVKSRAFRRFWYAFYSALGVIGAVLLLWAGSEATSRAAALREKTFEAKIVAAHIFSSNAGERYRYEFTASGGQRSRITHGHFDSSVSFRMGDHVVLEHYRADPRRIDLRVPSINDYWLPLFAAILGGSLLLASAHEIRAVVRTSRIAALLRWT
jgi:hypothetical protein